MAVVRLELGDAVLVAECEKALARQWQECLGQHVQVNKWRPAVEVALRMGVTATLGKADLMLSDRSGEIVECWVPAHALTSTATSFYYRYALPTVRRVCTRIGYRFIHAGLGCIGGKTILYAGPSGAGKTTISAAILSLGGAVHSDDQVFSWNRGDGTYWSGIRRPWNIRPYVLETFLSSVDGHLESYLPGKEKLAFNPWPDYCPVLEPAARIDCSAQLIPFGSWGNGNVEHELTLVENGKGRVCVQLPPIASDSAKDVYRSMVYSQIEAVLRQGDFLS